MWSSDLSMWSFDLSMWSKIFFLEILCIDVMSVSINVSYIYRTECVSHINVPTHTCTCTHTFTHTFTPTPTHTCPSYLSINVCVTCQSDSFSRTGCCTLAAITNITTRLQQQSTRFAIFLKITDCQEKSSRLLSHVWQSPMHMRHIHMCLIHMCLIHMCLIHTWLIHMWLIHMCLIHMWLIHMCLMKEESQREQSFCNLFENNRLSREIFTHARGIFKIYSLTCDIWHMREESWRLWRLWEESWRLLHVYQS